MTVVFEAYQRQEEELKATLERLQQNEALISSLQEQMSALTDQTIDDKELLNTQLKQMQSSLITRNQECEAMIHNLQYTVAEMDELHSGLSRRDQEIASFQLIVSNLKKDKESFQNESLELRNKLVQLIKDKDHLWKRCDQLVHLLRVQATNQWVSDASIRQCQDCSMRFTLFARRHHCRLCGRIFCHACSNHWLNTAACSKQVRTCRECYSIHWKFSHEPDQLLQNSDQEIECGSATTVDQPNVDDAQTDSKTEETVHTTAAEPADSKSHHIKNIRTAPLHSFNFLIDAQRKDIPSESFVSASTIFRVPLDVAQPNSILHWKFKAEPQGIGFAIVGLDDRSVTSADGSDENVTRIVVKRTFCNSEDVFVEGSAVLAQPGLYVISFDNSFSQYLAKKITYSLSLQPSMSQCP